MSRRTPLLALLALVGVSCGGPSGGGGARVTGGTTPSRARGTSAPVPNVAGGADLAKAREALSRPSPDFPAALLASQKALKANPKLREARLNAAYCLLHLDRYAESEALYRVAAEQADDREALLGWVDVLLRLERFEPADKALAKWLETHPTDLEVLSLAAETLRRRGAPEEALKRVQQALTVSRGDPLAYQQFGMLYLDRKDPRTALMIFNRGLQQHKHHAGLLLGRGLAWQALGEMGRAVMDIEAAVKEDGGLVAGRLLLGKVYVDNLDYVGAQKHFGAVLTLWPRHREALLGSARAQFGLRRFKEAMAGYQSVVREHGEEPRALFQIAKLYQDQLDSPQNALLFYRRFVKTQPTLAKDDPVFGAIKMLESMTRARKGTPARRAPAPKEGGRP